VTNDRKNSVDDINTSFDSLDIEKLKSVFIKSLPFTILFLIICVSISVVALRYTKQLFQSNSVLQLDIKSDAKVFGFKNFGEDINDLAREIEIIKSNLFLSKVAQTLDFDVSYYQYGDLLYEERYGNSPFKVNVIHNAPHINNKPIDFEIKDSRSYILRYECGGIVIEKEFLFNETVSTEDLTIVAQLSADYDPDIDNRYFFTLNTHGKMLGYINSSLSVEPLDFKAKTISISFKDHNKQKAHDIVYAIDTLYIYFTQLEKNKATNQKINFLDEQLGQTETKLTELESYFENFTIDNRTTNLDANLAKTIVMLEQLDSQRFIIQRKAQAYDEVYDNIINEENFNFNSATTSFLPAEIKQEINRLNVLLQEREALLSSYNKNTFAYQKKGQEINFLKERITSYIETARDQLYENINNIRKRRSQLESEFIGLPSKRTEYSKTIRYYGLYEEFYLSLIKNKAEFELAQAGTVTQYKILSPASMPSQPISPDRIIYYGIGVVAGLILSFLFVGIRYLMHNKITSLQELERLSSAFVLGTVPFYDKDKKDLTRLVVGSNLKSEISEAFRTIRTNLEFLNGKEKKPIIAITSTTSGEGKTFVAANLGGIISLLNNKVILVDLDMRKPRFHEVFEGTDSSKGLSTILINKHTAEECIQKSNFENLDYIPAGPIPPNPSELILGGYFETLMKNLESKYDVIIIDTPPVGLVTDGIHALKIARIPIYIVRADFSKKVFVKNINRLIKVNKLNNLSLILNSVKKSGKESYGYGKGYYEEQVPKPKKKLTRIFQG